MERLARLPKEDRDSILADLADGDVETLLYDWKAWARPGQLAPAGDWRTWLVLAGRGFGKTRTGAEWVREQAERGRYGRLALVAPTAADARDVMVEGESGILAISPRAFRPAYEPSKRRLTWPNGTLATLYSADEPDRLRGPQHGGAWCDESGVWKFPEAWDMLQFGLRLGTDPRVVVTTTPKPVRLVRELLRDPTTATTRGTTYDNAANLPPAFLAQIVRRYAGTRLGRQEIEAELLEDLPGALWTRTLLDAHRVSVHPPLVRVVVAIDPEASSDEGAAETGIVVAGLGTDGHGYVLADLSLRASPAVWGQAAVAAYHTHAADRVVAEVNNGGDMVGHVIRTSAGATPIPFKALHASRGKQARAEPVAALDEQGRIHHVGAFPALEDQLCNWVPGVGASPDRLDARVWAITELMLASRGMQAW